MPSSKQKKYEQTKKEVLSKADPLKIVSEITKRDIEKSYDIDSIAGTEVHYSDRYGWTLKRSIE